MAKYIRVFCPVATAPGSNKKCRPPPFWFPPDDRARSHGGALRGQLFSRLQIFPEFVFELLGKDRKVCPGDSVDR